MSGARGITSWERNQQKHPMIPPSRRLGAPTWPVSLWQVGRAIQAAAGNTLTRRWFYPLGPINDLVYPVDGGMEDWSYAAGWEASPKPITVCKPTTYGGYAEAPGVVLYFYSPKRLA